MTAGLLQGDFIGFGGLENVRFRGPVRPGDRLVLVAKGLKVHRRQTVFNVQGFVGSTMVFNADIIGVPMTRHGSAGGPGG
jgi:3-hydroxyacyl-[acyl-carrier-protein] dehydratase